VKIDVTQNAKDQTYTLTIKLDQFKNLKEYDVLHNLINAISLDFDLDPEITVEDLKKIVTEARNEEAEEILIDIGNNGVDLEF
jgi:uncharacterized protein with von Willebrand factor type A (vWA) domain